MARRGGYGRTKQILRISYRNDCEEQLDFRDGSHLAFLDAQPASQESRVCYKGRSCSLSLLLLCRCLVMTSHPSPPTSSPARSLRHVSTATDALHSINGKWNTQKPRWSDGTAQGGHGSPDGGGGELHRWIVDTQRIGFRTTWHTHTQGYKNDMQDGV